MRTVAEHRLNSFHMGRFRARQRGFGMLEVLITVLILAIGLLGVASLQSTSLRLAASTQSRSQAILLAQDMMDRVRTNSSNAADYAVVVDVACDLNFSPDAGDTATNDSEEWGNQLACYLPDGAGQVEWVAATSTLTVSVSWDDSRSGGDAVETIRIASRI